MNAENRSEGSPVPIRGERIAFIQACWHREIVDQARDAFLDTIEDLGFSRRRVELYEVPGTLEIPLQAKRLAETGPDARSTRYGRAHPFCRPHSTDFP